MAGTERIHLTAVSGQTVVLPCNSTDEKASWSYRPTPSEPATFIAQYGRVLEDWNQLALQFTPNGGYNLFINNISSHNRGLYVCTGDHGLGADIKSFNITIQGQGTLVFHCST